MTEEENVAHAIITFTVCKTDKISLYVFWFLILLLSVFFGVISHDVIVLLGLIVWCIVIAITRLTLPIQKL